VSRRLGAPQSRCGRFGEERNVLFLPGFEHTWPDGETWILFTAINVWVSQRKGSTLTGGASVNTKRQLINSVPCRFSRVDIFHFFRQYGAWREPGGQEFKPSALKYFTQNSLRFRFVLCQMRRFCLNTVRRLYYKLFLKIRAL
jgi:hypothetical protein